jgi:DNA primase
MNSEIKKIWNLIELQQNSIVELRAFADKKSPVVKHFYCTDFQSLDELRVAFEQAALKLNNDGFNIYTVMNPIKTDLQGRSAKDRDIACRTLLLIDIDRAGATKNPATDDDIKAARSLAKEVAKYLAEKGWPKPVQVMSGNGWHLYYKLDQLSNDDDTTALIKRVLKQLAKRFNNSDVNIDTVVYNASRITKVPGTIMRKGEESEGRPYRKAVVYE